MVSPNIGDDDQIKFYIKNQFDNLIGDAFPNGYFWQIQFTYYKECLTLEHSVSKRMLTNEISSMLWHGRLGKKSKERMMRPVKDGILSKNQP